MKKPKILALDIETSPMCLLGWSLHGEMHYAVNQIDKDWSILSWCAKFIDEDKIYYEDVSKQKNKRDDKKILRRIHGLINSADIIVSQNGKRFDIPKLNARFIKHGFDPVADKPHIDTKKLAKKRFGFSSASLEYMCQFLGVKHKKLTHRKFPGFELWLECLAGNKEAWAEMKRYNVRDVQALEDVYKKLRPWGTGVNLGDFKQKDKPICAECGEASLRKEGKKPKNGVLRQRFQCTSCGAWNFANIKQDGTLGRIKGQ